ncbi:MAG: hypothetical protein LUF30_04765 [Lachnospiraceae bacterium]|nr:hypothetical protein [Lachnospiraceae bacterium]
MWNFFLVAVSLLFGRTSLGSESFIADSVTVTWTNGENEQVDLTNQVKKEKVVKLLDKYSREWKPAEKPEQEPEPRKGDLEISVTDQDGDAHHIYLSKEGDNYYYSEGGESYRIPEGDELYQEIAAAL